MVQKMAIKVPLGMATAGSCPRELQTYVRQLSSSTANMAAYLWLLYKRNFNSLYHKATEYLLAETPPKFPDEIKQSQTVGSK